MPAAPRPSLRLLALSTTVALIAAIGTFVLLSDDSKDTPTSPEDASLELTPVDGRAEDADTVSFTSFDGTSVPLNSLDGQPTVVNFFASTCVPCVTEMPAFEQVHQQFGDKVAFIGLAVSDRPEDAQRLVRQTKVTYQTAQDRDGAVIAALGGTVLPTTVLLDADGAVLTIHSGKLSADELRTLLHDELGLDP